MNNVITQLEQMNLVDKFLFDEVMEDPESYQAVINILLENWQNLGLTADSCEAGHEIRLLTRPETEKEIRISPQLRQIRLDVISMDQNRTIYYTEMQKNNTGNLRKRSRYYQAQMDASLLEPGSSNFNLLSDGCFILIAPFDIFGKKLYRYTFEGVCRECPELKIKDGSIRVFINTKGTNREDFSQEFLDFMEYITASTDAVANTSGSQRIRLIHNQIKKIRTSEKMGVKLMQRWEEIVYARDEGKIIGGKMLLVRQICKKIAKGKTPEVIADELEEDLSVITAVCTVAKEFAPNYDCDLIYEKLCETVPYFVTESYVF